MDLGTAYPREGPQIIPVQLTLAVGAAPVLVDLNARLQEASTNRSISQILSIAASTAFPVGNNLKVVTASGQIFEPFPIGGSDGNPLNFVPVLIPRQNQSFTVQFLGIVGLPVVTFYVSNAILWGGKWTQPTNR